MSESRFRHRTRWQVALRYSAFSPTARAVGWALSTWMSTAGVCTASLDQLAEAAGCDRATVKRSLNQLEASGWVARRRGGGRGRPSSYAAVIPEGVEHRVEAVLNRRTGRLFPPEEPALDAPLWAEEPAHQAPDSTGKGAQEGSETGAQELEKGRTVRPTPIEPERQAFRAGAREAGEPSLSSDDPVHIEDLPPELLERIRRGYARPREASA